MAHVSSEVQKAGSDDGSAGAGNSAPSPPRDHAPPGDLDLRSVIEENAFQSLSEGTLIRRLCFTCSDPGADEDNDFRFMTFPRKLWKIVGSSQFKSIWWDEQGTSIVIHEDQFKKEVLERKGPFKIFETGSMKSLVRQLNLYGFSKLRQAFQRSASLRDFLAEEKEVSVLSKLQFYQNPNFKRGCPHLLVRMKRRVGIRSAYPASPFIHDFNTEVLGAEGGVDARDRGVGADPRGESVLPTSAHLRPPPSRRAASGQRTAHKNASGRSDPPRPPPTRVSPPEPTAAMDPRAVLRQLTTFHMRASDRCRQQNGRLVDLMTATPSRSPFCIVPHLQRNYLEMLERPSTVAPRCPDLSVSDGPLPEPATSRAPVVPKANDS